MHEGESGTSERAAAADPVAALEARLGLTLADRAVALAALTHRSYVNEHREDGLQDNERLEFLGDAVIDLAVSHRLMERFPAAREGDLSKMRAAVVDEQGLADMARALDLGSLLRLGRGEELTGGRSKASLLADAMEAVIAAVYHEQGLEGVLAVIDRFLGEAFARAAAGTLDRDFKTQLQELAQSRLRVTPRYRVVAEHGPDHSKVFEVEVDLRGEAMGRGRGRSKKDSEQAAARLALELLGRRLAAGAGDPGASEAARAAGAAGAGEASATSAAGAATGPTTSAPRASGAEAVSSAPGPGAPPSRPAPEEDARAGAGTAMPEPAREGAPVHASGTTAGERGTAMLEPASEDTRAQVAGTTAGAREGGGPKTIATAGEAPPPAGASGPAPVQAPSPAQAPGDQDTSEVPRPAAPRARARSARAKRAAPAKRPAAAKRPAPPSRGARAGATSSRARTGAKRSGGSAGGSAARGGGRPARKGPRARR